MKHFEPFYFGDKSKIIDAEAVLKVLGADSQSACVSGYSVEYLDISNMREIIFRTGVNRYERISRKITVEINEVELNNPMENDYNSTLIYLINLYHYSNIPYDSFEISPKKNPEKFRQEKDRIVAELRKLVE